MIPQAATRLIHALQDPSVWGEEVSEIQTLQTHMSWVLLTGPHAYKIKKPLDLGFADFSTLAERQHFCREELRINQRLAPELYLAVLLICGTPESPSIGNGGEPIEYAVQMKQFPQRDRMDRVLERDALTAAHLDALIRQMADFHRRIDVDGPGGPFGTPEAVGKPMQSTLRDLSELVDDRDRRHLRLLERLRLWSERQLEAGRDDFTDRKRQGSIRECHGDMHLRNIALWQDAICIFDAIEFNANLRWIDVLSEVAFLVMDLDDRGRADFTRRALNYYLEITGDYAGLVVLPFYLAYRALVRAKVAGIRRDQKNTSAGQRRDAEERLRSYLNLAQAYSSPPNPVLVLTHGLPGSGKTTGSARLVETLGAIRIRSDVERKRMHGCDPLAHTGSQVNQGLYTPQATRQLYERLDRLARCVLRAGFSVIVDAAFLQRRQRALLAETAHRADVPLLLLDFQADEATLRDRLERRASDRSDASEADLAVLNDQLRRVQPLTGKERRQSICIDTNRPRWGDKLVRAAADWCSHRSFGT